MQWDRLKKNLCPQCGRSLIDQYDPSIQMFKCICGFMIGAKRFKDIVNKQITEELNKFNS